MNHLYKKLGILTALCIAINSFGQDFIFSQYFSAQPYLNPAMTGFFDGSYRISGQYRNQWSSLNGGIQTLGINADIKIGEEKMEGSYFGLGICTYRDNYYSMLNYNTGRINASFTKKMGQRIQNFLSIGANFGMDYKQYASFAAITPQNIPENPQKPNIFIPNLGIGLNYQIVFPTFANVFLGGSIDHLLTDKASFYNQNSKNQLKYTFYTSARLQASEYVFLLPTVLYSQQYNQRQINFGLMMQLLMSNYPNTKANIQFGLYSRAGNNSFDALIPMFRYENRGFQIGLSYDFTVNELSSASRGLGAFELAVGYIGLIKKNYKSRTSCPDIKNF